MDDSRYPNIADHGLIGDLQTAALVTDQGVMDWYCCYRAVTCAAPAEGESS